MHPCLSLSLSLSLSAKGNVNWEFVSIAVLTNLSLSLSLSLLRELWTENLCEWFWCHWEFVLIVVLRSVYIDTLYKDIKRRAKVRTPLLALNSDIYYRIAHACIMKNQGRLYWILCIGQWTNIETPSRYTAQDTDLYRTIPTVLEFTEHFGQKREIQPVKKLKRKNKRNA